MTQLIPNQEARRLILHLQGLSQTPHRALGMDGLKQLIVQMGFVQLDSIQWVERAQHMILYARNQTYRPTHLKKLLEKEQFLFENWTHDASVIPSQFYPYWRHKFQRDKPEMERRFSNWQGPGYRDRCDSLMEKIKAVGGLRSRDLAETGSGPREMWQWHDGKAALEFLWRTGDLCIKQREGFQKVYHLAALGVPEPHFETRVSHDEFVDWACRTALNRLGFGSAGDIARFWDLISISEANAWLEDQGSENISRVMVGGHRKRGVRKRSKKSDKIDDKELYARADIASVATNLPDLPKRVRALSPFDPVIRDRKRLAWVFGFDYRIEIYVPEAKRIWGYYVFPLLEGDRLIGRIDMRAHRKNDALEVKALWLEPGVRLSDARRDRIGAELVRQARLAGVGNVTWPEDSFKANPAEA